MKFLGNLFENSLGELILVKKSAKNTDSGGIIRLVLGLVFAPIIPLIIILSLNTDSPQFESDRIKFTMQHVLIGLAISLFFFLDYCFGGLYWVIFYQIQDDNLFLVGMAEISFVTILINIVIWFFVEKKIIVENKGNNVLVSASWIIAIITIIGGIILYLGWNTFLEDLANIMLSKKPIWFLEEMYIELKEINDVSLE